MAVQPSRHFTPEEYLDREVDAEFRSEYINGEIYAMAGGSFEHGVIILNIGAALRPRLHGGPCRIVANDLRIKVEETELYIYPDLVVVCGEQEFEINRRGESVLNPTLLIEALSKSTEAYDRGAKFQHYRKIPSLREYLLVAQEKPHIERYLRNDAGEWVLTEAAGEEGILPLSTINAALRLSDVYADLDFGVASTEKPEQPVQGRRCGSTDVPLTDKYTRRE